MAGETVRARRARIAIDSVLRAITRRGELRFPDVLGHVPEVGSGSGWKLATDGFCALMVRDTRAWQRKPAPSSMVAVLFAKPLTMRQVSIAALQAWAGEPPVQEVQPCPDWGLHRGVHEDRDSDACHCFHECQWVEGLGYACERESRDCDWGIIAGIPVDRSRLAELLSCWPDGDAAYGTHDGTLYVHASGLRLALMRGNESTVDDAHGPAFEETVSR